ncbi:hypothetical protein QP980_11360 [Corynebacterium coyleae]|uniref:type II toxin-antitoxin system RelE/ParE family toxin n=1 Tax=Corynebacterium coyleae TaxID=53374 RepID=UPI00254F2A71|nr:type II toxin-antitoxin system RelE/ParE family toxin [Corynebacterium coyleae]MDK8824445.1 hypothetical protein [Corynebacterium coyleae]
MEIISSSLFDAWLGELKDKHAQRRILYAIARCEAHGRMIGDIKPVGEKVSEMRFHFGPGYRVYYTRLGAIGLCQILWTGKPVVFGCGG